MAQTSYPVSFGDGNVHCGNIADSFNTRDTCDEDAQIKRWLSPLEPINRHQGVRFDRLNGVGDWFLEAGEFREWRDGEGGADKAVLFCSGNLGVGKTYLSSLVIDSLCDHGGEENIVVAGLYCDYLAYVEQTTTNIIGAILKQLVGRGEIAKDLREAFQKAKKEFGGRGPRLADLMGMLRTAIASLPKVFICIDALDECLPKHLPELLGCLRDIVRESPSTRIFLTGRPHVREDIQRYFTKAVEIPISPNTDDVRNYLEMRLDQDPEPEAMNSDLRADIVRVIMENMSDIFLLVSLSIDAILGEVTIRQRRKKLAEMTLGNGLSDVYTATLMRLKAQKGYKSALGLKVLMWAMYSERRLRAQELSHALGVEIGSGDLDPEKVPAVRTLVSSCLGLVTVEVSSSTVRLVHFTLQEHLSRDPTLFHSPHSAIAEVCLTYLNFLCIRDLPPTLHSAPAATPLLEYASVYWGRHTRRGMTENTKMLALKLLDRFDEHISTQLLLLHYNRDRRGGPHFDGAGGAAGFTGLHGVAFLGIAEIVPAVLEMKKWDANAYDCMGMTALTWAAARGHEEVVKMLLERKDVNPDQPDTQYGRTPLSWVAGGGHEGIVKMLLERKDVNPDQPDTEGGRTPLSWTAENGHEGIVKMLLERKDVNPDHPDTKYGQTPLSWAAENGHEGIVKMLLERKDVNPDQPDTQYGRTPLSWVAENGHEGIAKMLLERKDVNPDQPDTEGGRTPLSWAAHHGHEGVVKMLLERKDVNPDQVDIEYGRTPLSWAAEQGHVGVVKILLERDVDPDRADTEYGRTPLSWAAHHGHRGVVKMLLERECANSSQAETDFGHTPLSWAARSGYEPVVKMLLEREHLNPDRANTDDGRTPLSWAAEYGHEGVVKMLLEREDSNPSQADTKYGRTPLLWAAEQGREGVVKMLLAREGVDPNQADTVYDHAPLSWAAQHGHDGVVEMLLGRKGVDPNRADTIHGRTPLSLAAQHGHSGVVGMLVGRKDVDPNRADTIYGRTPLSWAAEQGHSGAVGVLLEREDANPYQADTLCRQTPLSWAAEHGHEGVVKILLEREDVDSNHADTQDRRTPLSWAAEQGHEGVVKMLLEREYVNPDRADTDDSRTPLSWAAEQGHEGVVKMLLQRRDVNPNQADTKYGRTPLSWAAEWGHEGVVKMLLGREDVDPNQADTEYGRTPLLWAAEEGHEGVKMLLERDVDTDRADTEYGRTPNIDNRSLARWPQDNEHVGVAKPPQGPGVYTPPSPDIGARRPSEFPPKLTSLATNISSRQSPGNPYPTYWDPTEGYEGRSATPIYPGSIDTAHPTDKHNRSPLPTTIQEIHQESVKTPFIQQSDTDSLEGHERHPLPMSDDNGNRITSEVGEFADKETLSKSKRIPHSGMLATHLIQSSLDVLRKTPTSNHSRHLGRFKLWVDEYGTPHGQLDKILKESPILKEATITLLADLCNVLTTRTSHHDDTLSVLQEACAIYPGISQLFPDTGSDSGDEEGVIETIVDSLFNLSPLLIDALENLPRDTPTGVGNDEATTALEIVQRFDGSGSILLLLVFLFLLVSCLMLLYTAVGHAGRFRILLEGLRQAWFD